MKDVYQLYKHKYCMVTYIRRAEIYYELYDISKTERPEKIKDIRQNTSIFWNNWIESDIIYIGSKLNNYMDGFYDIFQESNLTEKDKLLLTRLIADFLLAAIKDLTSKQETSPLSLFHVCVVPSEWEEEIREDLIRPIFIKAKLIQENDHIDRLLFISDVESIYYNLKTPYGTNNQLKRGQNTVMYRANLINNDTALIKLNLIKSTNTLFDFPGSTLFPKVLLSNSFSITYDDIKNCIETLLREKAIPINKINDQDELTKKALEKAIEYIRKYLVNLMCYLEILGEDWAEDCSPKKSEFKYVEFMDFLKHRYFDDELLLDKEWRYKSLNTGETELYSDDWLMCPIFTDDSSLNMISLDSITPFDIYAKITQTLFSGVNDIISNQFVNECELFVLKDFYSSKEHFQSNLCVWLNFILEACNKQVLNSVIVNSDRIKLQYNQITQDFVSLGIEVAVAQAIRNSNIHCPPRIIHTENKIACLSIFQNSCLETLINIDISLDSTLLSCYLLNNDGSIRDSFHDNYFTANTCLPSLGEFFNLSNDKILIIKEQFIPFAQNCLLVHFNTFLTNECFLETIKLFLSYRSSDRKNLIYIHQKKYFNAFLLMYVIHIKEIIDNGLFDLVKDKKIKTGYALSVEKIVLDNIVDSMENLEELIYKSGLVSKDDNLKKLRIITQGEGILSNIQQVFHLKFPIKSYFVVAQVQENYIQLTLNQVVTDSNLEDNEQEAIIVEDRIISINNVYDSLGLEMWNNLIQDSSLMQLCNLHSNSSSNNGIHDLFCLNTKKKFLSNFKQYLLDKILAANIDLQKSRKIDIKLNNSCDCLVHLNINDIIEISFKPFLNDITSILFSPLIDKNLFGRYTSIEYHFSLLHFNHNLEFQEILVAIMKEETDQYKPSKGIDTLSIIIPKLQMTRTQLSFLYKGFRKGTLYQVHDKNYTISISNARSKGQETSHCILKQYDRTSGIEFNRRFYFSKMNIKTYWEVLIEIFANEESDFSKEEKRSKLVYQSRLRRNNRSSRELLNPCLKSILNKIAEFDFPLPDKNKEYFYQNNSLIVTVKSLGYSSSIQISVKIAGTDDNKKILKFNVGAPLTLCRY